MKLRKVIKVLLLHILLPLLCIVESLRAYFEKFGELSEVRVMISPAPEKKPR